jgi:hypothetical protein
VALAKIASERDKPRPWRSEHAEQVRKRHTSALPEYQQRGQDVPAFYETVISAEHDRGAAGKAQ